MALLDEAELGSRLRRAGVLAWSSIGIVVLVAIVFRYLLYPIRGVLPPLALAAVVVFLLDPLVTRLARGGSRVPATVVVYVIFVGVVSAVLVNVLPLITHQVQDLLDHLPDYLDRAARSLNRFAERRGWSYRIKADQQSFIAFVEDHRGTVLAVIGRARAFGESVLHALVTFLLALVLSFYMLVDLPKIRASVRELVPPARREEVRSLAEQIARMLGGFFRGQLLVAIFVGVASAVGLRLVVHLPFAFLVGLVAGLFNLVPLIGPFIGGIPAVFLGLLSGNPNKAWQAALVLLVVQQIDNHVVSPNVMGRTVKLHPITVIIALIGGAAIAGIAGMLVAVPGVAIVKILGLYAWEHRRRVIAPAA